VRVHQNEQFRPRGLPLAKPQETLARPTVPRASGAGRAPRTWLVVLCAMALCASALWSGSASAQSAARKPFSADERARLEKRELVTRSVSEKRGDLRLIGGSSWQTVDASPDALFRALLDTRNYHRMLPTVSAARLVSDSGTMRRVVLEHKRGPLGVSYRLALAIDRTKREITFKLNHRLDSDMRAAWGYLSVRPFGRGQSLLSYGVMADPGDGLLVGLARGLIHEWLLKVPQQTRYFVESKRGRELYGSAPARLVRAPVPAARAAGCRHLDGGQAQKCPP
jgi:hypothetical protein